MSNKILVTGANGFVGSALISRLIGLPNTQTIGAVRDKASVANHAVSYSAVGNISTTTDWTDALTGVDVVIHTAARVHVMGDDSLDSLAEYREINVGGTQSLATQAAKGGTKRFIYISSIKVNGENTLLNHPFTTYDSPSPQNAYGISKMEAEQMLNKIAYETGMEVVIIRPPLIYGAGMRGNFAKMIELIKKGYPLPLGYVHNKRSLIALENLIDLIITCVNHPAAANQLFFASDAGDVSITELLKKISKVTGSRPLLVPVPAKLLMLGAKLLGKENIARRVLGSLQVDISRTEEILGWSPPISLEEGLRRALAK